MSRNINLIHLNSVKKPARVLRPVRGRLDELDELDEFGGVEKFKSARRQARRHWRKEDERYGA